MKTNQMIAMLSLLTVTAFAQPNEKKTVFFHNWSGDLAVGNSQNHTSISLALARDFHFGSKKQWHIGVGWRNSMLFGSQADYFSAPPEYWNEHIHRRTPDTGANSAWQ